MTKIALFGTSADPPTIAHQMIIKWLSQNFELVAVWASENPLKNCQTSLVKRAYMLELLIEEIDDPKHNISIYDELSYPKTLQTLKKAKEIFGRKADFFLVIGSDLVCQISSWYKAEELLSQVKLIVMPRLGYPLAEDEFSFLNEIGSKNEKWFIADVELPEISSTDYRKSGHKNLIIPRINNYIEKHQLYEWQKTH